MTFGLGKVLYRVMRKKSHPSQVSILSVVINMNQLLKKSPL